MGNLAPALICDEVVLTSIVHSICHGSSLARACCSKIQKGWVLLPICRAVGSTNVTGIAHNYRGALCLCCEGYS